MITAPVPFDCNSLPVDAEVEALWKRFSCFCSCFLTHMLAVAEVIPRVFKCVLFKDSACEEINDKKCVCLFFLSL